MAQRSDMHDVIAFVDRTVQRGVPIRIAITRAERKFGVQRALVRAFYRSAR